MTPDKIRNSMFRHYLREAVFEAERSAAAPDHMRDWYAERFTKNFRSALAEIGFSLIRTEDVIAATKIVEKIDA